MKPENISEADIHLLIKYATGNPGGKRFYSEHIFAEVFHFLYSIKRKKIPDNGQKKVAKKAKTLACIDFRSLAHIVKCIWKLKSRFKIKTNQVWVPFTSSKLLC